MPYRGKFVIESKMRQVSQGHSTIGLPVGQAIQPASIAFGNYVYRTVPRILGGGAGFDGVVPVPEPNSNAPIS